MIRHYISRTAIWLLAIVMIVFGIQHFRNPDSMLVFVPPFLPGGILWVYLVGIAFIVAAVALIINRFVGFAGYLLAILLFSFVILIHLPNYREAGDAEMKQMALISLLKDLAIGAFALFIAANAKQQHLSTV